MAQCGQLVLQVMAFAVDHLNGRPGKLILLLLLFPQCLLHLQLGLQLHLSALAHLHPQHISAAQHSVHLTHQKGYAAPARKLCHQAQEQRHRKHQHRDPTGPKQAGPVAAIPAQRPGAQSVDKEIGGT